MATTTATEYINAAARCMMLRRLYMSDGSEKMMRRADKTGEKCRKHVENAAAILGVSYDDAFAMVSNRYRAKFL